MRWPSFLTRRRPTPIAEPHHIHVAVQSDPLVSLRAEIYADVAKRREARLSRPERTEARRFERARPKIEQLTGEIATMTVPF